MDVEIHKQDALNYHSQGRKGKIEVVATKPCATQWDLSLAYTPGVAEPCLEIQKVPERAFDYTAKGNLVAVVSNGTAVLGLGNIGALAGKPVMEGKGVLFKRFADIDVFDLEVGSEDPDDVIRFCQLLEPTVGGINLEDIKAPECFHIEETLRRTMSIPVFHDDQHGTAIISGAALVNALEIVGKDIGKITMVINGAGAAGIACAEHYVRLGMKRENIILCDTKGVVYEGRGEGMNPYKARFASKTTARTLAEAMKGADVFSGLSGPNVVTQDMVRSMADQPIIFAMANPVPEIGYQAAKEARADVIMATGRSDYPNQVNNVLGFPFIFRGALDVRARAINEEMKVAATRALAALAKEDVPDMVLRAYGVTHLHFGKDYIIPKPFDPRVLLFEASAVAQAAMESGVAQVKVDIEQYREQLSRRLGRTQEVMFSVRQRAKADAQAHRLFRRRTREDHPRQLSTYQPGDCTPGPAGPPGGYYAKGRGTGLVQQGQRGDHRAGPLTQAGRLRGGVLPAAPASRRHPQRGARIDGQQQLLWRHDGSHGRRRRFCRGRVAALP